MGLAESVIRCLQHDQEASFDVLICAGSSFWFLKWWLGYNIERIGPGPLIPAVLLVLPTQAKRAGDTPAFSSRTASCSSHTHARQSRRWQRLRLHHTVALTGRPWHQPLPRALLSGQLYQTRPQIPSLPLRSLSTPWSQRQCFPSSRI